MDGFLTHQHFKYFKLAGIVTMLGTLLYIFHQPQQEPNGGTWLGYLLGTVSALLIIWLIYYGRRKRDYTSTNGTIRGWLSAHVYLGSSLLILATLHTGFQFGLNIHTLAYVLMCLAIFSGFYGAWAYVTYPVKKRNNLDGRTLEEHFRSVEDVDRLIRNTTEGLPQHINAVVNSSIERTEVGGSFWEQVSARDKSKLYIDGRLQDNEDQQSCISLLVTELSALTEPDKIQQTKVLIDLFTQRKNILIKIRHDIKCNALMQIWLFFHIPVSIALLAALVAHIFAVFIYW
ncbi:MAG: hypothetical protein ACFHVJ_13905 [Aestuariibacter sp.]